MGFGKVKGFVAGDFGGDRRQASLLEFPLIVVSAGLGLGDQGRRIAVNRGAILAAAIITLAHALGGVVAFPEELQEVAEIDGIDIPNHSHHLRMTGAAAAHFFVAGIGCVSARVAHGRGDDPG